MPFWQDLSSTLCVFITVCSQQGPLEQQRDGSIMILCGVSPCHCPCRPCSASPGSRLQFPARRKSAAGRRRSWQETRESGNGGWMWAPRRRQRGRGRMTSQTMPSTSSPHEQPKQQDTTQSTASTTPLLWDARSKGECWNLRTRPSSMSCRQPPTQGIKLRPATSHKPQAHANDANPQSWRHEGTSTSPMC